MTDVEAHEDSPFTETRTQKSPLKYPPAANIRSNFSAHSHHSNMEMAYMKLRQQSQRDIENYTKQIELLKDELFRRNEEIEILKSTVILGLKKELNEEQKKNINIFKEREKLSRQIERLSTDNHNMNQELEKQGKERNAYFAKLDDLKAIKEATRREIIEKDKIIRTFTEQNRKTEKQLSACRLQIEDMSEQIAERDKRLFESESQYKAILQKSFIIESELKSLQLRQRDNELMISNYVQKIADYEREKERLLDSIEEQENRNNEYQQIPNVTQSQMLQIKSLMDQLYNLVDQKKQDARRTEKRFLASLQCLEKNLTKNK